MPICQSTRWEYRKGRRTKEMINYMQKATCIHALNQNIARADKIRVVWLWRDDFIFCSEYGSGSHKSFVSICVLSAQELARLSLLIYGF